MPMLSDHATVQLPARMQADDLLAVGDQLHVCLAAVLAKSAKAREALPEALAAVTAVPASVSASWARFAAAHGALRASVDATHAASTTPEDTSTRDEANADADAAWTVFDAWLAAWTLHADDGRRPSAADAAALRAAVFPLPEGRRFIAWRPRRQWQAMLRRMPLVTASEARAVIEGLGGGRILARLESTHAAYGKAYGFTAATAQADDGATDSRPQFLAAKDALRDYVKKVEGHADPDVSGSEALSAWLLGPFAELVDEFAATPAAPRAKKPAPAPVA